MSKIRRSTAKRERVGVHAVAHAVENELGWIFREEMIEDYGIDAQIEIVQDETVTGRLIAVQIKSGPSYFIHPTPDGWDYYLNADDLDYWVNHSLPVIVVLVDEESPIAYWELVSTDKLIQTRSGGSKIHVSSKSVLGRESRDSLNRLSAGTPYELQIRQLRLALPWMELLRDGRRLLLEANEWINKTSGRGDIVIVSVNEANEDRVELGSWMLLASLDPYEDVLPSVVPWADVVLHDETYDVREYEEWQAMCVYDERDGESNFTQPFADWRKARDPNRLRPYANSAGEVDHWRLELILNSLGRGFLAVNEYAGSNPDIESPAAN